MESEIQETSHVGAPQEPGIAMSVDSMAWNRTGSWKYLEPYYEDWTPPCAHACPAGNDIVSWLQFVEEGHPDDAARSLLNYNPFPAVLGCVCPHPCQTPCNRKALGGEISIQAVERFLGEYAIEHDLLPVMETDRGQHVTIVGTGPSGLSAAYFLRRLGYGVTMLGDHAQSQGALSLVPAFRLPRRIVDAELDRFLRLGIVFKDGGSERDLTIESMVATSDACLFAIGPEPGLEPVEGLRHPLVLDLRRVLEQIRQSEPLGLGRRVAIIGSDECALDCARSLVRFGHEAILVHPGGKADFAASKDDLAQGIAEGVRVEFLTAACRTIHDGDSLTGLICVRSRAAGSETASRNPLLGTEFILEVDAVVAARGRSGDRPNNTGDLAASGDSVFKCHDVSDSRGLAQAVSAGRNAASAIHSFLSGQPESLVPMTLRGVGESVAKFKDFNKDYFTLEPAPTLSWRDPAESRTDFDEVRRRLSEAEIRREGARCFKCGTCTLCGNCDLFCPDNSIVLEAGGSRYQVRYQYCKGCMVCIEECPRGAIHSRRAGKV